MAEPVESSNVNEGLADMIAGLVGSACNVYSGQPFDTVKTRMQLIHSEKAYMWKTAKSVFHDGGIRAFWKGSIPALTGQLMGNPVAFVTNGFLKRLYHEKEDLDKETNYSKPIIIGATTGVVASFVCCPFDIIKIRAQAKGRGSHIKEIALSILRKDGIFGFWKGILPQVVRDIPLYAAYFGSYDLLCAYFFHHHKEMRESTVYMVAGGIAGSLSCISCYAQDTIKSRIQVNGNPDSNQTMTIRQSYRSIVDYHGIRGLFNGIKIAIIRAYIANAALFLGFEYSRKFSLHVLNEFSSSHHHNTHH
jgi:hypothetical protein